MEFESNAPITDEQRLRAATKQVTIEPLNSTIVRDEEFQPPTFKETHANVDRDSETTSLNSKLLQPTKSAFKANRRDPNGGHFGPVLIAASIVVGIIFCVGIFIVLR